MRQGLAASPRSRARAPTGGNDAIDGQNDEDTVNGRGGNDSIADSIDDGAPNHLFGGAGDDGLSGSSGNDDLHGQHIRLRVTVNDAARNRATKVVRIRLK